MSDEDSLNEMSAIPQRLMPKVASITEHHRVLGANALHAGNAIATDKAHKVRIDGVVKRVESLEEFRDGLRDDLSDLKEEMAKQREASTNIANALQVSMAQLGGIVGKHSEELAAAKGGLELKKVIIIGVLGLLGSAVTAFGGYAWGHTPTGPSYQAPTHQQAVEVDRKLKEFDPNNQQRIGNP
jgi:hypothetical protein